MSTIAAPRTSARISARPSAARPSAARSTSAGPVAGRLVAAGPVAAAAAREVDLWAEADRSELRRVYRRRRFGVAALLVLGLSSVGYGFADADPHASVASTGSGATVHVVRAGETLWGIARAAQPEGDVRPLVDRLARQLEGDTLVPGTRLVVA